HVVRSRAHRNLPEPLAAIVSWGVMDRDGLRATPNAGSARKDQRAASGRNPLRVGWSEHWRTIRRWTLHLGCLLVVGCRGWLSGDRGTAGDVVPDEVDEQKPLTAMWAEFGGLMALFDRRVDEVSIVCMSERGF